MPVTWCRSDGLFVLRLVSKNAGDLVSTELLAGLWNAYSISHRHVLPATSAAAAASNNHRGSGIRSLLRSSKKTLKGGKANDHHVVDMASPQNVEDV